VLAEPDDDARRAVYADALQERGEVRGEIIALQLAGTPEMTAKAARLVEKHRKALLGGIAKNVIASTAVFEKGFLVECETDVRRLVEADVAFGRAEWATVKRLTFRSHAALTPAMRSLEEVYGVTEAAISALRKITLPKLRVLELREAHSLALGQPIGGLGALLTTTGLPALREVRMRIHPNDYYIDGGRRARAASDFAWLFAAPCARQLTRVVMPWSGEQSLVPAWQEALAHHPTLQEVVLTGGGTLTLTKQRAAAR
jgi:uncharacterized protein (TIGR02996 family)